MIKKIQNLSFKKNLNINQEIRGQEVPEIV